MESFPGAVAKIARQADRTVVQCERDLQITLPHAQHPFVGQDPELAGAVA